MFKESMGNEGGSNENKESEAEKEVKEKLLKLFAFMEKIINGFDDILVKDKAEELKSGIGKIFTLERVSKLSNEVEEIFALARKCERFDIKDMISALRFNLGFVNDAYKEDLLDNLDEKQKYVYLMQIKQSMQVLTGAQQFFTKEKEVEEAKK